MLNKLLRSPVGNTASLVIWFSLFIPLSLSHQGNKGLPLDTDPIQNLDLGDSDSEYEDEFYEDDDDEDGNLPDEFEDQVNSTDDADLEDSDSEEISAEDLTELVTNLEREAHEEEQRGLLPQIISFLKGALTPSGTTGKPNQQQSSNQKIPVQNGVNKKPVNPEIEGQNDLPEDLSDQYFQDDLLVDDIAAGIEESLFLSGSQGK